MTRMLRDSGRMIALPALALTLACGGGAPEAAGGGAARDTASGGAVSVATGSAARYQVAPGDTVRADAGHPACRTRESYDRLTTYVAANDRRGFAAHMDAPQSGCIILSAANEGVIQEVTASLASARLTDSTNAMWAAREAWMRR